MPRDFAARVDSNQAVIVAALKAAGYVVCDTSRSAFGAQIYSSCPRRRSG